MAKCCDGSSRKNAAALGVLTVLLVIAITGWVREATKPLPAVPQVETVEVLVATKYLTEGTVITTENVETLTATKRIPREQLPPDEKLIQTKEQLIGRRLAKAVLRGDVFDVTRLWRQPPGWPDTRDIYTFPVRLTNDTLGPKVRIDILTTVDRGTSWGEVVTLLADMDIIGVNGEENLAKAQIGRGTSLVSILVTEAEWKLLALAQYQGCQLDAVLRHPDAPPRYPTWNERVEAYDKTLKLLKSLARVPVAATELTAGTGFTPLNVTMLTTTKQFIGGAVPEGIVSSQDELVGKRIGSPVHAGAMFKMADLRGEPNPEPIPPASEGTAP